MCIVGGLFVHWKGSHSSWSMSNHELLYIHGLIQPEPCHVGRGCGMHDLGGEPSFNGRWLCQFRDKILAVFCVLFGLLLEEWLRLADSDSCFRLEREWVECWAECRAPRLVPIRCQVFVDLFQADSHFPSSLPVFPNVNFLPSHSSLLFNEPL